MPDRTDPHAERAALVERLASMPQAMRDLPQWLLWKLITKDGAAKPSKVPFYASGHLRGWPNGKPREGAPTEAQPQVEQGHAMDRTALCTFEQALAAFSASRMWAGVGFAFLPGDGLIGVDIDGAVDPATGEVSDLCGQVVDLCSSYTERSVSGTGVHIIVAGETKTNKDNGIGLEMFCGRQFFTCTGAWWPGSAREVRPAPEGAIARLHEIIDTAKAAAKAAKAPAAAPAHVGNVIQLQLPPGDDFKRVNDAALASLSSWVPQLFPQARTSANGYRVTSKDLGRELEEDLSLTPTGIMDFGREMGFTPIDLVIEWSTLKAPKDALHWLANCVGVQLSRRPRAQPRPPEPPPEGEPPAAMDDRDIPPDPHHDGEGSVDARALGGRSRRKKSSAPPEGVGGGLLRLEQNFRLIYGTDAVWDGEKRITMAVKNLRLVFGNDAVKMWLASGDRKMVMQQDMVFEPGTDVPEHQVNLFDGLALEPIVCTDEEVAVMLELLTHLCSMTATGTTTADDVKDWVLKWLAYPLQNIGAKMRSALVFHGPQGTGKNLFFDCIRGMYGKYGRMVGQTELDDKFNDWLSAKLMIIGNEVVTRQELFHNKNKLKWIVTEDEIPIRGMHQTVRWESNHAQVVFLSNENQPIVVEQDDRRHLVVYTPVANDADLYLRVADFLKNDGAAKFLHYLQRYDTSGFGEHTKPLMTEAKAVLIELSLKPAERFVNEWLKGFLPLPVHVCSAEQLYRVFRRWGDMNGERWPVPQATFTETVKRHVNERVHRHPETGERLPPKLAYKVVMLKHEAGPRKAMRCWIPRGSEPPEGISEGEWAGEAVEKFDHLAARYGRMGHADDDDRGQP